MQSVLLLVMYLCASVWLLFLLRFTATHRLTRLMSSQIASQKLAPLCRTNDTRLVNEDPPTLTGEESAVFANGANMVGKSR